MPKSVLKMFVCLLLVSCVWEIKAADQATPYQVKAAFIYNFIKFVEWPADAFKEANSPFVVGVLGKDPFGAVLNNTLEKKMVNGHPIVVRSVSEKEMRVCQVLFVSNSEKRRLKSIFGELKGTHVLTIGETDEFAQNGGIINFVIEESKVRFQINIEAAKRADLKIHSTLLNLSKVVRERAS